MKLVTYVLSDAFELDGRHDAPKVRRCLVLTQRLASVVRVLRSTMDRVAGRLPESAIRWAQPLVLFSEFWCSGISDALEIKEKRRAALTRWPMSVRFFDFFFGDKRPIMTRLQSVRRDYKGELAVVIFRTGRHMTLDKSLGFVEEETSITDGTAYGYLKHIAQIAWGQKAVKSNSFDPWIMGMNEIHVAYGLELICRSNGKEIQHGSTGYSSFHFRRLSLYMSTWDTPRYGAIMPPKRLKAAVVNVSHEYGYVL